MGKEMGWFKMNREAMGSLQVLGCTNWHPGQAQCCQEAGAVDR